MNILVEHPEVIVCTVLLVPHAEMVCTPYVRVCQPHDLIPVNRFHALKDRKVQSQVDALPKPPRFPCRKPYRESTYFPGSLRLSSHFTASNTGTTVADRQVTSIQSAMVRLKVPKGT